MQCANTLMQAKSVIPYAPGAWDHWTSGWIFQTTWEEHCSFQHGIWPEKKKSFRISFKKKQNEKVALVWAARDLPGLSFRTGLEFKLAHK